MPSCGRAVSVPPKRSAHRFSAVRLGLLSGNRGDAEILAGGTDLLALMKDYVVTPKRVVNIKQLPGVDTISAERNGLRVGALITNTSVSPKCCI